MPNPEDPQAVARAQGAIQRAETLAHDAAMLLAGDTKQADSDGIYLDQTARTMALDEARERLVLALQLLKQVKWSDFAGRRLRRTKAGDAPPG